MSGFELLECAGQGGMGAIFRARHQASGNIVAIKMLRARSKDTGDAHERFVREAKILGLLDHDSIVRYVDWGTTAAGEPFLVMEWLEGETLDKRLKRGTLSVGDTVALGARVAEGLAVAHERNVVHRDVKPSNIFLPKCEVAHAKLIDFGIARALDAPAMTLTGLLIGTPAYMSPEQARGERTIDERTDVFSLGVVLFKCVTGTLPFEGNCTEVLAKLLFQVAPRLAPRAPAAPRWLTTLVDRMLARDPRHRPASCRTVLETLRTQQELAPEALPFASLEPARLFVLICGPTDREAIDPTTDTVTAAAPDGARSAADRGHIIVER